MKKGMITGIIVAIIAVIGFGGAYYWYQLNYGATDYYTQITTGGTKQVKKFDNGSKYTIYHYDQPIYDKNGDSVKTEFNSVEDHPLKMNAYIKVGYNKHREQVLNWEKVDHNQVPKKALEKIDK
ncbi:YxeA family protein [Pediococcus argentinicus]|uniref:YxeA family protein n=1 Tax=Pediococcus argentinicus TaxID=480391 RepID=A0A0R2NGX8_9LACO|nr:YxeA family protein [Pediococcus argentinicus]KRO21994.1 hypothetical protein IV88_GL001313 [Pediococcus argentinicus]GEP20230.1 hypothetical protein LSA03_16140 [Pediococcus argentinicus]